MIPADEREADRLLDDGKLDHGESFGIVQADGERRLMVCVASGRPVRDSGCNGPVWLDMKGADLRRLNSGFAPVLLDHLRSFDCLVGIVERAWVDGAACYAVLRLGPTPKCGEVWEMIRAGILRHVSVSHYTLIEPEADGTGAWRAAYWWPFEVSLVSLPADWRATIRRGPVPRRPVTAAGRRPVPSSAAPWPRSLRLAAAGDGLASVCSAATPRLRPGPDALAGLAALFLKKCQGEGGKAARRQAGGVVRKRGKCRQGRPVRPEPAACCGSRLAATGGGGRANEEADSPIRVAAKKRGPKVGSGRALCPRCAPEELLGATGAGTKGLTS